MTKNSYSYSDFRVSSPVMPSSSVNKSRKKALYERRANPPPPIHAPIVIRLGKEDFESDDEEDEVGVT